MLVNHIDTTITVSDVVQTTVSDPICLTNVTHLSIQSVIDVDAANAAEVFAPAAVDATGDLITMTAHGYETGIKGQFTTVTTLPGGLSLATDYFIIVVDANTVQIASTVANAVAGTAIDITDQGVGNHTFTPTALAGGSVKIQKSNDKSNWTDVAAATAVTADASAWFEVVDPTYKWVRLSFVVTAGTFDTLNYVVGKGPG